MTTKPPKEIVETVNKAAMVKAKMGLEKTLIMGFLAGAFIAFGGFLAIMVGGGIPGIKSINPGMQKFIFGATFPVGLMLVVIAGSELFTGNTAISVPGALSGRISCVSWTRNMFLSYNGNLSGPLFVAFFLAYLTQTVGKRPLVELCCGCCQGQSTPEFWGVVPERHRLQLAGVSGHLAGHRV